VHLRAPVRSLVRTAIAAAVTACAAGGTDAGDAGRTGTSPIDCVAVLGAPPPSSHVSYTELAYSGVPRDKRISELSTEEIGKLCDLDVCLTGNGYARVCLSIEKGAQIETRVMGTFMVECAPTADFGLNATESTWSSRSGCISAYQENFGGCHVGAWEDCLRESRSEPLGVVGGGPDCAIVLKECPLK
jgi:hypothetical protein